MGGDNEERPRGRVESGDLVLVSNLDEFVRPDAAAEYTQRLGRESRCATAVVIQHHREFSAYLHQIHQALERGQPAFLPYQYEEENRNGQKERVQNRHKGSVVAVFSNAATYRVVGGGDGIIVAAVHHSVLPGGSDSHPDTQEWIGPASESDWDAG